MEKLAVLGPEGTISEQAAKQWIANVGIDHEVVYYDTISKVMWASIENCQHAIVPIENVLDGYVFPTFDGLLATGLLIRDELIVPVDFAFVAHANTKADVKKIYVQYKTEGQCRKFLDTCTEAVIATTESNGASLEEVRKHKPHEGAIIPHHTVASLHPVPKLIEDHVADTQHNFTRFVVIGKPLAQTLPDVSYKTSLAIIEVEDKPGALARILQTFAERAINLTSIMSRPTREKLGQYHFFIDIEGKFPDDNNVFAAVTAISAVNAVKVLGSYPVA